MDSHTNPSVQGETLEHCVLTKIRSSCRNQYRLDQGQNNVQYRLQLHDILHGSEVKRAVTDL